MKIFSLFLPQFYETKENNEWWGEGFTEWTNVKNAKSLRKGQVQPLHPLNDNYYNMLDKSTMEWQTSLMHKYGLYGMIYYHYYFNGKLLLEKPAENLLRWKDIDQPFFFCWANHTWYRSWEGSKKVLVEQTYGDKSDWKRHFDYLLPFFKDDRYEKADNMPLFMIYDSQTDATIIDDMFYWFDHWGKEAGFGGIKCIRECFHYPAEEEMNRYKNNDLMFLAQPSCGRWALEDRSLFSHYLNKMKFRLSSKGYFKRPPVIDGNRLYKYMILKEKQILSKKFIPGIFFGWDNTPRHKNRGFIIDCVEKRRFFEYMDIIKQSDYLFVNAWNEWAEGMVMEPSEEYGYRNLKWIKEWIDRQISNDNENSDN